MSKRSDLLSIVVVALVYFPTQWYVSMNPAYDVGTFVVGALVPLAFSILLPIMKGRRVLLYAFLAYFWALVEDGPVFLDSLFTWPEVTRFNPAGPHIFLEVIYHILTGIFLVLSIRETTKGKAKMNLSKVAKISLAAFVAFVLAYAQNIPLTAIQTIVETQWYQLDILEHVASAFVLYLALREASRTPGL